MKRTLQSHYNKVVPGPLIPTPFDQIGRRTFLFYPPIVGIEHNEWTLRRITSSEVQVVNAKTAEDLWIPRRFLGEVSAIEDPFLIAGLVKELEYKAGAVIPHVRRVIEMPRAVNGSASIPFRAYRPEGPASVVGIRVETGISSKTGKRLLTWLVAAILTCIAIAEALIVFGGHRRAIHEYRPGRDHRSARDPHLDGVPASPGVNPPLRLRGY